MGGYGELSMKKLVETENVVTYEYWLLSFEDTGIIEFDKQDGSTRLLKRSKDCNDLMMVLAKKKLVSFFTRKEPYPDTTYWAG